MPEADGLCPVRAHELALVDVPGGLVAHHPLPDLAKLL